MSSGANHEVLQNILTEQNFDLLHYSNFENRILNIYILKFLDSNKYHIHKKKSFKQINYLFFSLFLYFYCFYSFFLDYIKNFSNFSLGVLTVHGTKLSKNQIHYLPNAE